MSYRLLLLLLSLSFYFPIVAQDGGDVVDSSGIGHDGTIIGEVVRLSSAVGDGALQFNQNGCVELPANLFSGIDNEVTIALWVNGGASQPAGDSLFYGYDAGGNRALNVHLPWRDGNVYFDAGGVDYDRIYKSCSASVYKNSWHHWAFIKNATTGEMKIYLDGNIWHSGTEKWKTIPTITQFRIGEMLGTPGEQLFYDGMIDDFRIISRELDAASVKTLASNPPSYISLKAAYFFNEGTGDVTIDSSATAHTASLMNSPSWNSADGNMALDFNSGQQQMVELSTAPSVPGKSNFTVASWIKTSALKWQVIAQQRSKAIQGVTNGWNGEWRFELTSEGKPKFWIYGNWGYQFTIVAPTVVADGQWHHVAAVRDGDNGFLYVDGVLVAQGNGNCRDLDCNIPIYIGADQRGSSGYFTGTIDTALVYHMAISGMGVKQLAANRNTVLLKDPDFDKDNIANDQEIEIGISPFLNDSDGDTINDYDELYVYYLDPTKTDSDGDSISDLDEITRCPLAYVTFPDPNFEAVVRDALNKPEGDLTNYDMLQLTELVADSKNISDLTGIEDAINLTRLSLKSNNISDITPLMGLPSLTYLNLHTNNISDISAVGTLSNLKFLSVTSNSAVSDISAVVSLTSLKELYFSSTDVSDLTVPSQMPWLTAIGFQSTGINDLSLLAGNTALTKIEARYNNIVDISPLQNMTEMRLLYLQYNHITDISALAGLSKLECFEGSANEINDLTPLQNLTELNRIYLGGNHIQDITPLEGLSKVTKVYLEYNHLEDISSLLNMAGLSYQVRVDYNYLDLSEGSTASNHIQQITDKGISTRKAITKSHS